LTTRFVALAAIASTVGLTSCGSKTPGSFSISPAISSLPVNSAQIFSSSGSGFISIANAANNGYDSGPAGIIYYADSSTEATPAVWYISPATPPVYPYPLPAGVVQGSVTLDDDNILNHVSLSFVITAHSITVGLVPATVTVPRNSSQQFNGYAVGNVNNALTWQVNGVTGGSSATGFINILGVYTAPANIPMTGNTVTITVLSQADPTKTAVSTVTIS
jgi:hypothetical protein